MEQVLLEAAVRAVLLALAIGAVVRVMRINTAAGRHAAWTIALVAMLLSPAWILWGPEAPVTVGAPQVVRILAPSVSKTVQTTTTREGMALGAAVPAVAATGPIAERTSMRWGAVLWVIYGFGALLLLGRLAIGTWGTRRLIRDAVPSGGRLTSPDCVTPITAGWLRPVTILPTSWDTWSQPQRDVAMAHEQEHVRRRDPLVQWVALLNRAVFWFHPLAWWLERRLAALAEEACDSAVLRRGYDAAEYSECLLTLARSVLDSGSRVKVVGSAMPGPFLPRRIHRILNGGPEVALGRRRFICLVGICALVSALLTAATIAPAADRMYAAGARMPQAVAAASTLSEYWFDDDEWHLEVASIMSPQELETYRRARTTAEREAFIGAFWRRRDPTPNTETNEFRQDAERRIAFAREHFANPESAATFGYQTDRGRWYVMFGPPNTITRGNSSVEEWRYASVNGLGSNVVLRFDPRSKFGCSYRGGLYRIVSPPPLKRFEGSGPIALTYPGGFVYLSFPIDAAAVGIRWGLRARSGAETVLGETRDRPIDFVQGTIEVGREPILSHVRGLRLFEADGIACTEQLPPDEYTLWIETTLLAGNTRGDTVAFTVD
jgi:GWxTD domain-containing protein